ncbi:hypothetical protein BaRGS_00000463 [Batillaria attramentaria]|uniref:Uncharacterized protein n=1 Tax=Batillaria attramentaria TaxID=370345 RepID=A0ABD0M9T6_9CAEN
MSKQVQSVPEQKQARRAASERPSSPSCSDSCKPLYSGHPASNLRDVRAYRAKTGDRRRKEDATDYRMYGGFCIKAFIASLLHHPLMSGLLLPSISSHPKPPPSNPPPLSLCGSNPPPPPPPAPEISQDSEVDGARRMRRTCECSGAPRGQRVSLMIYGLPLPDARPLALPQPRLEDAIPAQRLAGPLQLLQQLAEIAAASSLQPVSPTTSQTPIFAAVVPGPYFFAIPYVVPKLWNVKKYVPVARQNCETQWNQSRSGVDNKRAKEQVATVFGGLSWKRREEGPAWDRVMVFYFSSSHPAAATCGYTTSSLTAIQRSLAPAPDPCTLSYPISLSALGAQTGFTGIESVVSPAAAVLVAVLCVYVMVSGGTG